MGMPLSIVDHVSFKNFMNDVDPKYKPIHRRDITRSFLPTLHQRCIKKLQEICAQSTYVSLTLDVWTDRRKHTSEKLSAEFDRIIQLYNLNGKVVRLITDNASNNLAAFNNIILPGFEDYFNEITEDDESGSESNDEESDDCGSNGNKRLEANEVDDSVYQTTLNAPAEEEFMRLPCFSHSLQLVVNDGIKASGTALSSLKKVAELARLAHCSTQFAERLEKVNHRIPKANRTRWNSQFQTVKKVINIPSSTLNSILTDLKKNDLILTSRDRKSLEEFVSLFELFNQATVLTQGESYATVTLVAPTVLGILYDLQRELSSSTLILTCLCEALISSVKARFSGLLRHFEIDVPFDSFSMSERFSDIIFVISPLFDGRFKLLWLDNLHTVVKMRVLEKLRGAFVRFFSKLNLSMSQSVEADVSNERKASDIDETTNSIESLTKRKCLFPYFNETKKNSFNDKLKILIELDAYLCEESNDENLLFSKKHIYPCLYQLGLKYLSVPATSAPIERIFSQSGFLMRSHRASLSTKNVCLLTFLKCNKVLL
ncbi:unnamed protein product [Rotaria magnacalcarata]|nr:unnamed protein product [Rotaria magnacalcarata]CAF2215016.1 unnamed protein product [Rotaria magnacalcarata]